ncbi:uncharacterized protein LOC126800687 [Argentina anserina]|uniref:uncharacterized protein LOC126800687 n=1 Tax=Argentina anserina TaxID=57926 RepID=UPI0021767E71|nr:uncharacterized protein LOC126800687 [Potentilla anserina]
MEGPSLMTCDEKERGLVPRVVNGLFDCIKSFEGLVKYSIKVSMVGIYMEKVWDLFDLSKDNIQIDESKEQAVVMLDGVTEISVSNPAEALQTLSRGVANRTAGEAQMNMPSSRSHCIYLFTVQQELKKYSRLKTGKLILVDLAGSEKAEKTGAKGKVLEETKTINKSLTALGNVINALTCGLPDKANHIPYRHSKLTWLLQDALGGNSQTALLCCCSPSLSNASESLSTLHFGMRCVDPAPDFELIFIQFPHQNYCLSVILEANDTVDTIKAKYNREYEHHINSLGPQYTLLFKGRALTVDDDLQKLGKNSFLYVEQASAENLNEGNTASTDTGQGQQARAEDLNESNTSSTDTGQGQRARAENLIESDTASKDTGQGQENKLTPIEKSAKSLFSEDEYGYGFFPEGMDSPQARNETLGAAIIFLEKFRKYSFISATSKNSNRRVTSQFLPAEYAPITCKCWTALVHSLVLHLATNEWCSELPPLDTPENQEETLIAVTKFFKDFRLSMYHHHGYPTRQSTGPKSYESTEYAPLRCKYWTPFAHSALLHLATCKEKSLDNFCSSLIC